MISPLLKRPADAWDRLKESEFAPPDESSKGRPKPKAYRVAPIPQILCEGRTRAEPEAITDHGAASSGRIV